jgi:hypothetical protein
MNSTKIAPEPEVMIEVIAPMIAPTINFSTSPPQLLEK